MAVRGRDDVSFTIGAEDRTKAKFALVSKGLKGLSVAAAAATVTTIGLTKAGLDNVDSLKKTADKLGVTTEALAGMRFAAKETANMAENTFDMALQRMTRRLSEAAQGSGEAVGAINELGLSARHLASISPDRAMLEIADAMQQVENQSDRVRLSFKFFDSEGVALAATMRDGSAAFLEGAVNAEKYGLAVDDVMAARVEKAQDALGHMGSAIKGVGNAFAVALAPMVTDAANALAGLTANFIAFFNLSTDEELKAINVELAQAVKELRKLDDIDINDPEEVEIANALEERVDVLRQRIASLKQEKAAQEHKTAQPVGGSDASPEEDKLAEKLARQVEQLDRSLLTQEERIDQSYQRRTEIVENAFLNDLISEERHNELFLSVETDKQSKLTELARQGQTTRAQFQQLSMGNQVKGFLGFMENMTAGVATSNREMFELNKVAAIANAAVKLPSAVMSSLEAYPWPFNLVAAGATLAAGLSQIGAINSAQFNSSTSAPSIGGGGATPVTNVAPTLNALDSQQQQSGGTVQVTIEGNVIGNEEFANYLADSLKDKIDSGDLVIISGNSRQAQEIRSA